MHDISFCIDILCQLFQNMGKNLVMENSMQIWNNIQGQFQVIDTYSNMSGKIRQRTSANTEKAMNPMNTNERILRVRIYTPIFLVISDECMYAVVIIKAYWYFTGMPSVVHGSRQWTMWDRQQSWLLPFGTKEENKHHAHWKPLGWKIFIH